MKCVLYSLWQRMWLGERDGCVDAQLGLLQHSHMKHAAKHMNKLLNFQLLCSSQGQWASIRQAPCCVSTSGPVHDPSRCCVDLIVISSTM